MYWYALGSKTEQIPIIKTKNIFLYSPKPPGIAMGTSMFITPYLYFLNVTTNKGMRKTHLSDNKKCSSLNPT